MIRYILSFFIRTKKVPKTKGDVLRYALKLYLRCDAYGLCICVKYAIIDYNLTHLVSDLSHTLEGYNASVFPLFNMQNAVSNYGGRNDVYWWPVGKWRPRYKFMKDLIKVYDKELLK